MPSALQVVTLALCAVAAEAFSATAFMGGKVQLRQATSSKAAVSSGTPPLPTTNKRGGTMLRGRLPSRIVLHRT